MNRLVVCIAAFLVFAAAVASGEETKKPQWYSESPLVNYSQGGVVVDGVAYFTADDSKGKQKNRLLPEFGAVVAFDVKTLTKVRSYDFDFTYDSSPFLFQKKDGTWLVIAHEHTKKRTSAFNRDTGELAWRSAENQPGAMFFGYSYFQRADGSKLIFQASENGLHAMSGETGQDVWWVEQKSSGGVTPCVDQKNGWVFYQCNGKVLKIQAEDGKILKETPVASPNQCVSWNTVLVNDSNGYFVATRWYGKPEWDSAIRVYDKDLNLVWEKTGQPNGKKDTLTYADGKILSGSGNHWSGEYEGDKWKVLTAYSVKDGSVVWTCDLSKYTYGSVPNVLYYNGFFYAETNGYRRGKGSVSSHLLRIAAKDGKIVEDLDYGYQIGSCAALIMGRGRALSGCLSKDSVIVTRVAENSKADWPGPFGDPQTNTYALPDEPYATLAPMEDIGHAAPLKVPVIRRQEDCERDRNGNLVLLPRAMTETIGAGLVIVKKGENHPAKSHPDEEEMYYILKGEGLLLLGDKKTPVSPGMTIYIPRNTLHSAECTSDEDLEYIYFACWPD